MIKNQHTKNPKNSQDFKVCPTCGKKYFKPVCYSPKQWENRKHCSKKCANLAQQKNISDEKIIQMYLYGKSSVEIAKRFGVSDVTVRRRLKRHGFEMRGAQQNKRLSHARHSVRLKMSLAATGRRLSEDAKDKLRLLTGPKNHNWKSGMTISPGGYLGFTNSSANGVQAGKLLHQVIAEWKYGRKVRQGEHVHHVDGNKLNNDPDNLIILSAKIHAQIHAEDRERGKRCQVSVKR